MICEKFQQARLIRRYKRFLADAQLLSGELVRAHCPNPGSMIGLADPDSIIWLRPAKNLKRSLPYTWVLTQLPSSFVSVDTLLANKIVHEALQQDLINTFAGYARVEPEKVFGTSRLDFYLSGHATKPDCLVEVKSVTMAEGDVAMFPDARTIRGRKHLECLMEAKKQGFHSVQLFLVARSDCKLFCPADHIDKEYGQMLRKAAHSGVELVAISLSINKEKEGFRFGADVPVDINLTP